MLSSSLGRTLPVDAVFVKGQDLKVDESTVTGETDIMRKDLDSDPFFISGTNVLEGGRTRTRACMRSLGVARGGSAVYCCVLLIDPPQ